LKPKENYWRSASVIMPSV